MAPRKKPVADAPPFEPDEPEILHYTYPVNGMLWCEHDKKNYEEWKCTHCKRFYRGHTVSGGKSVIVCAAPIHLPKLALTTEEKTEILNVVYQGIPLAKRTIPVVIEHYRNAVKLISETTPETR